jgi:hypothetical protein
MPGILKIVMMLTMMLTEKLKSLRKLNLDILDLEKIFIESKIYLYLFFISELKKRFIIIKNEFTYLYYYYHQKLNISDFF